MVQEFGLTKKSPEIDNRILHLTSTGHKIALGTIQLSGVYEGPNTFLIDPEASFGMREVIQAQFWSSKEAISSNDYILRLQKHPGLSGIYVLQVKIPGGSVIGSITNQVNGSMVASQSINISDAIGGVRIYARRFIGSICRLYANLPGAADLLLSLTGGDKLRITHDAAASGIALFYADESIATDDVGDGNGILIATEKNNLIRVYGPAIDSGNYLTIDGTTLKVDQGGIGGIVMGLEGTKHLVLDANLQNRNIGLSGLALSNAAMVNVAIGFALGNVKQDYLVFGK